MNICPTCHTIPSLASGDCPDCGWTKVYCANCQYFHRSVDTVDASYYHEQCLALPHDLVRSNHRTTWTDSVQNVPHITNKKNDCTDFVQLDD